MQLPSERGPISRGVIEALAHNRPAPALALGADGVLTDPDVQLALWVLYELHYAGFDGVPEDREWDPGLISLRRDIERRMEGELRAAVSAQLDGLDPTVPVGDQLLALVAADDGPSVAAYLQRRAPLEHVLDYLRERSVQQLKESDPQSFVLPRLRGAAKVALAELQYDEYGAGQPQRLHQTLYARALEAAGLDPTNGAYVDAISGVSLAGANLMSLFALNRRLRGAACGHFAALEASSSVPSRKVAAGIERVGLPDTVAAYFHEHVVADAVHEQVAARDLCGSLVASDPTLRDDVLLGASCGLLLDALSGRELLARWTGRPALEVAS